MAKGKTKAELIEENNSIKEYYNKLLDEYMKVRVSIEGVDIDEINELMSITSEMLETNWNVRAENLSLKNSIDKNNLEIQYLKQINNKLSKQVIRQKSTINKFSNEIKEIKALEKI
jgi:hypothetical protein